MLAAPALLLLNAVAVEDMAAGVADFMAGEAAVVFAAVAVLVEDSAASAAAADSVAAVSAAVAAEEDSAAADSAAVVSAEADSVAVIAGCLGHAAAEDMQDRVHLAVTGHTPTLGPETCGQASRMVRAEP